MHDKILPGYNYQYTTKFLRWRVFGQTVDPDIKGVLNVQAIVEFVHLAEVVDAKILVFTR